MCVYVHVCVYVYVCPIMFMCVCMYVYTVCVYVCTRAHTCVCVHTRALQTSYTSHRYVKCFQPALSPTYSYLFFAVLFLREV